MIRLPQKHETDPSGAIAMGRRTIATEAEALWALAQGLDQTFGRAVQLIQATAGRLIVCGLGGAGQIADKIASTLMASGTPACFLHAGDAVHGDIGTILRGDALLMLSNSGDARELGIIVRRAAMLAVPIIAITATGQSAIADAADVVLMLPARAEACPFGRSPTTSTTMMLALGDALAVALLRLRGLDARDLVDLHPGSRLGLDLVAVEGFMHSGDALPLVAPDCPLPAVLAMVSEKGLGQAIVIDSQQRLLGIITDGDIRRNALRLTDATAADVMVPRPRTLSLGAMARDALVLMAGARITSVVVIDSEASGRVRGLVHIHDLLWLGIA
ncbi:KpsF/GutQ family sugar-phosphate isomerase [Sphingomonas sp. PAMC 26617]|uniref:KpsF/GutQ family sugar-phosphate isomerase n=1 Tax=Sphingomonas sp. PAMC 26617 TaxID=1112216 RepID=UPI000287B8DA|nr:KpsF/GutQ family sugar-phosphate isomerase [Sphingomonas sp. PAMC 26617]